MMSPSEFQERIDQLKHSLGGVPSPMVPVWLMLLELVEDLGEEVYRHHIPPVTDNLEGEENDNR